jgi:hypothetical protein
MRKQNTTNEGDKKIRRKYVYYYQHETDFHGVTVEEADLLSFCAVWLGNLLLKFRRNVLPSSSGYESIHRLLTLKVKRYIPSKRRDEITQPHGATTQNTSFLIRKQDLQRIKSFSSGLYHFQCVKRKPCRYTRRIFNCNILFSLSVKVTQSTRLAVINVAIFTFTSMLWRTLHTAVSVTYTGARVRFNRQGEQRILYHRLLAN